MQQCLSYHPPTDTYSSSVKSFQLSGVLDPFARHISNPILNVSGKKVLYCWPRPKGNCTRKNKMFRENIFYGCYSNNIFRMRFLHEHAFVMYQRWTNKTQCKMLRIILVEILSLRSIVKSIVIGKGDHLLNPR